MAAQPSQQEIEQARSKTQELAQQARSDPAFAQQLKSDPAHTLKAQGLPTGAIEELLYQWRRVGAEVAGYQVDDHIDCLWFTEIWDSGTDPCVWFTT